MNFPVSGQSGQAGRPPVFSRRRNVHEFFAGRIACLVGVDYADEVGFLFYGGSAKHDHSRSLMRVQRST